MASLWEDLEKMSMQYLLQLAGNRQQERSKMKELDMRLRHDSYTRQLDVTTNILYKKYDQLDQLEAQLDTDINESEGSQIAFSLLNNKDTSNTGANDLIKDVNHTNLESLNNEIGRVNEDIQNVRGERNLLRAALRDVSSMKRGIEEQLITKGPGSDFWYSPYEVSTDLKVPRFNKDDMNLMENYFGELGGQMTLDNMLSAIKTEGLNTDVKKFYDLNNDNRVDSQDMAMLSNLYDTESMVTNLQDKYPDIDITAKVREIEDFYRSGSHLQELNKLALTKFKVSDTGAGDINATKLNHINSIRSEFISAANNKFMDLMSTFTATDDDDNVTWNPMFEDVYDVLSKDKKSAIYGNSETERETNKEVMFSVLNTLATSGDYTSFLQRWDDVKKSGHYNKMVQLLEQEVPIFAVSISELNQQVDLVKDWTDYYFSEAQVLGFEPNENAYESNSSTYDSKDRDEIFPDQKNITPVSY